VAKSSLDLLNQLKQLKFCMRFFQLLILFLQFGFPAFSEMPYVVEMECSQIKSNIDSIKQWTLSRSAPCSEDPKISADTANKYCRADVSSCLPPEVISYSAKEAFVNGPNCWNLAMVMSGVLPALRYSTAEEMAFFMNSPLCRQLKPGEKKRPGDIGAIRTDDKEFHGFMWVSDDIVFSKNGFDRNAPYALQLKQPC
jgi:hypothetical protein